MARSFPRSLSFQFRRLWGHLISLRKDRHKSRPISKADHIGTPGREQVSQSGFILTLRSKWSHCLPDQRVPAGTGLSGSCALSGEALQRLQLTALEATHNAVVQFQLYRQPMKLQSGFDDVRSLLHVHSRLSHDSQETPEGIRRAPSHPECEWYCSRSIRLMTTTTFRMVTTTSQTACCLSPVRREKDCWRFPGATCNPVRVSTHRNT